VVSNYVGSNNAAMHNELHSTLLTIPLCMLQWAACCRRLINVDFADIKAVMRNSGTAMLGVGYGVGPDRALQAAYGEQQQQQLRLQVAAAAAARTLCNSCCADRMLSTHPRLTLLLPAGYPDLIMCSAVCRCY
jgi:hypothetical protein